MSHLVVGEGRRSRVTGFPIGLTLNEGAVIFQHASWGTKFYLTKTIQPPVCVPRVFNNPVVCAISCLVCNDVQEKRMQGDIPHGIPELDGETPNPQLAILQELWDQAKNDIHT